MKFKKFDEIIPRGLVVSCQALPGHPLCDPLMLAAIAKCVLSAGAVAIRAGTPQSISQIRARNNTPVIGLNRWEFPGYEVSITPTFAAVHDIAIHGPQVIALDGTDRPRPEEDLKTIIDLTHKGFGVPTMADIDSVESAEFAIAQGADAVATTLSGYTPATQSGGKTLEEPDLDLVEKLVKISKVPVVAEGRFNTPEQVTEALKMGAHSVVIGRAITWPEVVAAPLAQAAIAALA